VYRPPSPETPFWMVHPVCWSCSGTAHDIFHSNPLSDNPLFYSPLPPPVLYVFILLQELQRRGEVAELRGQLAAVQQTLSAKLDALETAQGTSTPGFQNVSHLLISMSLASCSHDGVHKCCQWQQATYAIAAMVNRDVSMLHSVCQQACDKKTDHAGCSRHGQDGWCG
jgi:hypothetical protein